MATATARADLDGRGVPAADRGPWRARRGRRLPFYSTGVALVLASVLGCAWLVASAGDRTRVVAVARAVGAGQVIAAADLTVVSAGGDTGLGLIPVERVDEVVGRTAVVPLVVGTLVQPAMLGDAAFPVAGRVVASVALKPGRYPQGLAAGSSVAVFVASAGDGAQPGAGGVPPVLVRAVVLGVDLVGDGQGATVVTLELARADAVTLAGAPADGVTLMQTAVGG